MEVCVDCVLSARNAEEGGAARLELCSALSEGGLTPSVGFLQVVKSVVKIPVFVMIRPRRGLDFVYSDLEVNVMEFDVKSLKAAGANGFVFGALTMSREVDEVICNKLLKAAAPLPCTFHRAFDMVQSPLKELDTIISLGFQRILTSGQAESVSLGVQLIKDLIRVAQGKIEIMPGAGITEKNLGFILSETGAKEYHASARKQLKIIENDSCSKNIAMGTSDNDSLFLATDKNIVEDMVKISKRIWAFKDK